MKKLLKIILAVLLSIIGLITTAALCLGVTILVSSGRVKRTHAREQISRVHALEEAYARPDYVPEDEAGMTGFDVEAAIGQGARLNDIRFVGTHNSYKAYNPSAEKLMRRLIAPLRFAEGGEWSYGREPLSAQFDKGIRSIELDVMREKDGFRCAHIPLVDFACVCPDFSLALKEIALWSDAHPGHLPITVLIEAKETFLSGGMGFHRFTLEDVLLLEETVAEALGERLYTPADMLGEHENFVQLCAANDYPALGALLGKVLVIYHADMGTTRDYAAHYPTPRAHKMFLSVFSWTLRFEEDTDYACFVIENESGSFFMAKNTGEFNMLVRTRMDVFPWRFDEWEAQALSTGAFILTTDYPPRDDPGEEPHVAAFEGGATAGWRVK